MAEPLSLMSEVSNSPGSVAESGSGKQLMFKHLPHHVLSLVYGFLRNWTWLFISKYSAAKVHLKFLFIYFMFWPSCVACRVLIPWTGIEPMSPVVNVQTPNPWTTREIPKGFLLHLEYALTTQAHRTLPDLLPTGHSWFFLTYCCSPGASATPAFSSICQAYPLHGPWH